MSPPRSWHIVKKNASHRLVEWSASSSSSVPASPTWAGPHWASSSSSAPTSPSVAAAHPEVAGEDGEGVDDEVDDDVHGKSVLEQLQLTSAFRAAGWMPSPKPKVARIGSA